MLIYNYVLNDEPAVIIIILNFDHLSYLYHDYKDLSNINNIKCIEIETNRHKVMPIHT